MARRNWLISGLRLVFVVLLSGLLWPSSASDTAGMLQIRNGYFWDPAAQEYFIPRGIAYQSWNPPVGANQSFAQLDYDLLEFKKMYANSVRSEFVWGEVQVGENEYNWEKPDHLIRQAERLGLRLFVIIGFQYPPAWFPPEWRGINDQGLTPDVLACLATNQTSRVADCLPKPIYDHLFTNQWPAEVITTVLQCLTSNVPSGIIGCLKAKLPLDYQSGRSKVLSYLISDVINYEHPEARRAYTNHIAKVVSRYQDSPAIGAWIMGNEFAYFDLWESPTIYRVHRFIGYDPHSQAAFRSYLKSAYKDNIAALNANWRTSYSTFDAIEMPRFFPADRAAPSFHDLIQWRQQSIGNFIAAGALTARTFDPNHLLTYSMVGGIFNGNDANNTCEDAPAIVAACQRAGAPLDFWSINNYAWASYGSELRTGDFGISKYQELTGLPVMISETGHSSTEDLFLGANARQAKAVPGQVWESLLSGAIGTHLFHWNDRNQFTRGYFDREKGFGIVHENRRPKDAVYSNVLDMFRRMQDVRLENLLGGSHHPPRDVQLFWSKAGDLGWPRANQENAMLWGALRRAGFQPGIIDDARFQARAYTNAPALLLSRAWQLNPEDLDKLGTEVMAAGVHLHANADLPGQFDAYLRPNPKWPERMKSIFGLDVSKAAAAYDSGSVLDVTTNLALSGVSTLGGLRPGWTANFSTWKIWHGVKMDSGTTVLTHTGVNQSQVNPPVPGLVVKTVGPAKTAVNTFAVADTFFVGPPSPAQAQLWNTRYDILRAIYRSHFGLTPVIDVGGPGAKQVLPDYRLCRNGSVLVSLLNEHTAPAVITVSAPRLLAGKTVENLSGGGIIETNSDGNLSFSLSDDDYILLYAYNPGDGPGASLINSNPSKLWFTSAPLSVWPRGAAYEVGVGYDTLETALNLRVALEQVRPVAKTFAKSPPLSIRGRGTNVVQVPVPDADLNDPDYVSSADGVEYVFRAILERDGVLISETSLPVRLVWSVRPVEPLPSKVTPGSVYQVALQWQELPEYDSAAPVPLDRAALWESTAAHSQHYNVVLELRGGGGQVVASDVLPTSQGSDRHTFTVTVPRGAQGAFSWTASVQSSPKTGTLDIHDSFEGRERGLDRAPFYPWFSFAFSEFNNTRILAEGIKKEGTHPSINQSAFLVVMNPPNPGAFSGFGLVVSTSEWALPADRARWTDFVFSFDFREESRLSCFLELQVKDAARKWIQFTKPYTPREDGWDTVRASLAEFVVPSEKPGFDPNHVRDFVLNIRTLQTNAIYTAYFDNAQFTGPPNLFDDFEDRIAGENFSRIAPWIGYGYDQPDHDDIKLDQGVHLQEASDGSQSAFMVAWYRTNSGAWGGFGMFSTFSKAWSLPADRAQWRNYTAAFDFKERFGKPCLLEIQFKNKNETNAAGQIVQKAIHFTKPYPAGTNGWITISASLDQFIQHKDFDPFDPSKVDALVLNVQMLEKHPTTNVIYVASFDNIRFDAPETIAPGEGIYGVYSSANDFFGIQRVRRNSDGSLTITWPGEGTLQSAEDVTGPWIDLPQAKSPQMAKPSGLRQFFRLRR